MCAPFRIIVLEVATNPNLGSQAARGVLDQVGDGVKSVTSLRPENFDKVYEACRSLLGAADVEQKPHVEQSLGKVCTSTKLIAFGLRSASEKRP
jgi:hypothetical protein